MEDNWRSTRSNAGSKITPSGRSIAVDDDLLSAITSGEAAAVTPQMSRIFMALIAMIPDDPENSLPVAQEWLFEFDAKGSHPPSPWRRLQEVVGEVDEQELRRALYWMRKRHMIDLRLERQSLYLTIRNVVLADSGENDADPDPENSTPPACFCRSLRRFSIR